MITAIPASGEDGSTGRQNTALPLRPAGLARSGTSGRPP